MTKTGQQAMPVLAVLAAAAALSVMPAANAEVSGHVALTSEYIYRGLSWSDGNPALQAGVDYEHDSGFFGGLWATTVDLSNPTGRRDLEFVYYLGYHFASDSPVGVSASLVQYTYPDDSSNVNYDYLQALLTTSWKGYSLEVGYTEELYGFDVSSHHVELRGDWAMPNAWIVSAGLGYQDSGTLADNNHLYWDVGASARFSRVTVDLRWYDNQDPEGFLGRLSAGSNIVGTVSLAF